LDFTVGFSSVQRKIGLRWKPGENDEGLAKRMRELNKRKTNLNSNFIRKMQ